jgi:hypothetical protein
VSTLPLSGPKFRAFDANGDPLSGGKLYSYAAGTLTPLNTFTTFAGTIANTNPVILDANGEADVWTTPGLLYKFVLKDSADVIQWTVDNYPSGSGAGTAATTNTAGGIDPGGRLTLTSQQPISINVTGATTVFYTPMAHNKVPLYDGASWTLYAFTELSQALSDATKSPAAATDDTAYDMFIWNDAGTLRLSRGPAWTSQTVRGTGPGSTDLIVADGRVVNNQSISNGPAQYRGLYVGSILVDNGGVADSYALRHVWNNYQRLKRPMRVADAATSWTYSTDTYRQAHGLATNELNFFVGREIEPVTAEVLVVAQHLAPSVRSCVGIGLDSVTVNSATAFSAGWCVTQTQEEMRLLVAQYEGFAGTGRHALKWLERSEPQQRVAPNTPNTTTWHGTDAVTPVQSAIWGHIFG